MTNHAKDLAAERALNCNLQPGLRRAAMVKISVLQHAPSAHLPARRGDPTPTHRNLDPLQHPFARARERIRALNAAKMERMFSKHSSRRSRVIQTRRSALTSSKHHHRCHKNIKMWDVRAETSLDSSGAGPSQPKPLAFFQGKEHSNHHTTDPLFATSSTIVQIWDETKSAPVMDITFSTSAESVTGVRFNPSEPSVLASIGSDRTFILYDIRTARQSDVSSCRYMRIPERGASKSKDHPKITISTRSTSGGSDPEPDLQGTCLRRDVLRLVTDWHRVRLRWVGSHPTHMAGRPRYPPEVYHTKRMQRVLATAFTADARFVLSGSDDGNVRVWKANASEKLGIVTARERSAIEYRNALKERWKMDAEIGKVQRSRHLPKPVYKAGQLKRTMQEADRVKEERRRRHTRAGESKPKAERKKVVIAEQSNILQVVDDLCLYCLAVI
ncbi:Sof1-like domain-containing protein [Russula aff. rugulosa BPL654]|nr:Sof1-like domain-containing protein [Russula aff. rugulosa BPL654]